MAIAVRREAEPIHLNNQPPTDVFVSTQGERRVKFISATSGKISFLSFYECFIDRDGARAELTTRSGKTKTLSFRGLEYFEVLPARRRHSR